MWNILTGWHYKILWLSPDFGCFSCNSRSRREALEQLAHEKTDCSLGGRPTWQQETKEKRLDLPWSWTSPSHTDSYCQPYCERSYKKISSHLNLILLSYTFCIRLNETWWQMLSFEDCRHESQTSVNSPLSVFASLPPYQHAWDHMPSRDGDKNCRRFDHITYCNEAFQVIDPFVFNYGCSGASSDELLSLKWYSTLNLNLF